MRSGVNLAVWLLLFAALLLFVQTLVPTIKVQVGPSQAHCCPECNDEGGHKTHQVGESCCSYTSSITLHIMHIGALLAPLQNRLAHHFEATLNPQLPGHSIFHPPTTA